MPRRAYVPNAAVSMTQRRNHDQRRSCNGTDDSNRTLWYLAAAGCLMIWMLPVPVLAVTLGAMGMQLRATRLFGDIASPHRRTNHSLSTHPTTRH
jgi:hypothetical protein